MAGAWRGGDGLEPGLSFGWEEHGVLRCHALKAVADLLAEGGPGLKPDLSRPSRPVAPHCVWVGLLVAAFEMSHTCAVGERDGHPQGKWTFRKCRDSVGRQLARQVLRGNRGLHSSTVEGIGAGLLPRQAYDLYGEAAELFMVSMKAKLANECYEKQAMLEADIDFSDDEAS